MVTSIPISFRRRLLNCARTLSSHPFIVFYGENFTGKTHTACHLVLERVASQKWKTVKFMTGAGFIAETLHLIETDKSERSLFNKLVNCDGLILDDYLGFPKEWEPLWSRRFNEIFRSRGDNNRQTIITTNVAPENMVAKKLDPKISSRIADMNSGTTRHYQFIEKGPFNPENIGEEWEQFQDTKESNLVHSASSFVKSFLDHTMKDDEAKSAFNLMSWSEQNLVFHILEDTTQKSKLWKMVK